MVRNRAVWAVPLVVVTVVGMLLTGCTNGTKAASGSDTAAANGNTPQSGGSLVVAMAGDAPTINPDVTSGTPDRMVGCNFYPSLVRQSAKFQIEPWLATSWKISKDGLQYTFQLAPEAKWQDGVPLTSADVKYTLLSVSSKFGPSFAAAGAAIKGIETPDDNTVVISLKYTFGPFLGSLTCANNAGILPKHVFEGKDVLSNPATTNTPVSAGPFLLKDWVRGDHITLSANPDYWQKGRPYLDQIVYQEIPQDSSRVLALQSGEVDYINGYYLPLSSLTTIKKDSNLDTVGGGLPSDHQIILNVQKAPLNKPAVRQALMTALDRNYFQKNIFSGNGKVVNSAIDQDITWAYNPAVNLSKMYPYDPAKANKMLDAAGLKKVNGVRFSMDLVFDSTRADYVQWASAIKQYWKAVGVDVNLKGSERTVELTQVFTDRNFDATLQAYSTQGDPALGISRSYVTSSIQKAPFTNGSGYSNPIVDQLFKDGLSAATNADRAVPYFKVQTILAKDLPVLPMVQETATGAFRKNVHGTDQGVVNNYAYMDGFWKSGK